jgi:hypothetical protein
MTNNMQLFLAYLFIPNQLYMFRAMSSPENISMFLVIVHNYINGARKHKRLGYAMCFVWQPYRGADKSLARLGRKQATATKL